MISMSYRTFISEEMARVTRLEPSYKALFLMYFILCFSILVDNLATFW